MFTITINKEFSLGEQVTREVRNKEEFNEVLNLMYDTMEQNLKSEINEQAIIERVWSDILQDLGFEAKNDFWDWIKELKSFDLVRPDLNMTSVVSEIANNEISSQLACTDYSDLEEVMSRLEELESAISDIEEAVRYL